ncbi:MAG: hypothetical protein ABI478_03450 [Propionivibrio sp.]
MALSISVAKRRLAQAWFFGATAVAALLLVLTLFGDPTSIRPLWEGWFVPGVMPNLSLIIGVLVASAGSGKRGEDAEDGQDIEDTELASVFVFKLAFWLSCTYLGLMLVTLLASPLTAVDFQTDLENSRYFLAPLQALATAALGAFYVRRAAKAASK